MVSVVFYLFPINIRGVWSANFHFKSNINSIVLCNAEISKAKVETGCCDSTVWWAWKRLDGVIIFRTWTRLARCSEFGHFRWELWRSRRAIWRRNWRIISNWCSSFIHRSYFMKGTSLKSSSKMKAVKFTVPSWHVELKSLSSQFSEMIWHIKGNLLIRMQNLTKQWNPPEAKS